MLKYYLSSFFLFITICSTSLLGESELYVPEELKPWVQWVKDDNPQWECSRQDKQWHCNWPGAVHYKLRDDGGEFELKVVLQKEGEIQLPSSATLKPFNITASDVKGRKFTPWIIQKESQTLIKLPIGSFIVKGKFLWKQLPREIPLPESYGIFSANTSQLSEDKNIERRSQKLWLSKKISNKETESVKLSVMRRVVDALPLRITTKLNLQISGKSRPLDLGVVIPKNSQPISIHSTLPYHLSSNGNLSLQVQPGIYEISVTSAIEQPATVISLPKNHPPLWPPEEIWSFQENPIFRAVKITGGNSIHSASTNLPKQWRNGAIYIVDRSGSLKLNELRRGLQDIPPNQLHLSREFWPDINDGNGLTVRDNLMGTMQENFRLNFLAESTPGRVLVNEEPVLITQDPKSGAWGIENRNSQPKIEAIYRLEDLSNFSSVGWDTQVETLHGIFNVPPSWKLIDIIGADEVHNSWFATWSLLELFIGVLIFLGSWKVFGKSAGALVALCFVINHSEFLSPRMLFVYLLLLFVWRIIITDRNSMWSLICNVFLYATFAALLVESMAFAKLQFTQMLFPQLQSGTRYRSIMQQFYVGLELSPLSWASVLLFLGAFVYWKTSMAQLSSIMARIWRTIMIIAVCAFIVSPLMWIVTSTTIKGSYGHGSNVYSKQDNIHHYNRVQNEFAKNSLLDKIEPLTEPNDLSIANDASISPSSLNTYEEPNRRLRGGRLYENNYNNKKSLQKQEREQSLASGPALSQWSWRYHQFQVSGPVSAEHKIRPIIIGEAMMRCISGLRVVAILLLIFILWKKIKASSPFLLKLTDKKVGITSIVAPLMTIFVFLFCCYPSPTRAEVPDEEILNSIKNRLIKRQCKKKKCASIQEGKIILNERTLEITLSISSNGRGIITLPGPISVFIPKKIFLDDVEHLALRQSGGFIQASIPNGMHVLKIIGQIPDLHAFSLEFPDKALMVKALSKNWGINGLSSTGYVPEMLRFTRKEDHKSTTITQSKKSTSELPLWLHVQRVISIDDKNIIVSTNISRGGKLTDEVQTSMPLLNGEKITSGNVKVENNRAKITFPEGVKEVYYSSNLPSKGGSWSFQATKEKRISEEWKVSCSPNIHCSTKGINPTKVVENEKASWVWYPFPGEIASVRAQRLNPLQGNSITVDSIDNNLEWGSKLLKGSMQINARVTSQTSISLTLPEDGELLDLQIDGVSGSGVKVKNSSQILLNPGKRKINVKWQKLFNPKFLETMPEISLSIPVHNLTTTLKPSLDRWLIWTGGPTWGPSVIFWAKLIVVIALCLLIQNFGLISGNKLDMILLGIGLTSLPIIFFWIPLFWLGLLKIIPQRHDLIQKLQRNIRITLFIAISFLALTMFYKIVNTGLVLQPPMLVAGNGSYYGLLKWYVDHSIGDLVRPWVISLPISFWRGFSFIWAVWLVIKLFTWMKLSTKILMENLYPKNT